MYIYKPVVLCSYVVLKGPWRLISVARGARAGKAHRKQRRLWVERRAGHYTRERGGAGRACRLVASRPRGHGRPWCDTSGRPRGFSAAFSPSSNVGGATPRHASPRCAALPSSGLRRRLAEGLQLCARSRSRPRTTLMDDWRAGRARGGLLPTSRALSVGPVAARTLRSSDWAIVSLGPGRRSPMAQPDRTPPRARPRAGPRASGIVVCKHWGGRGLRGQARPTSLKPTESTRSQQPSGPHI